MVTDCMDYEKTIVNVMMVLVVVVLIVVNQTTVTWVNVIHYQ